MGEEFLRHLDEFGVVNVGAHVGPGDVLVGLHWIDSYRMHINYAKNQLIKTFLCILLITIWRLNMIFLM